MQKKATESTQFFAPEANNSTFATHFAYDVAMSGLITCSGGGVTMLSTCCRLLRYVRSALTQRFEFCEDKSRDRLREWLRW
jgi:hypothetical protein